MNDPFYYLDVVVSGCPFELRVNDVPILRQDDPVKISVELPLNQWVFSGDNQLRLVAKLPEESDDFPPGSSVTATLCVKPLGGAGDVPPVVIGGVKFDSAELKKMHGFQAIHGTGKRQHPATLEEESGYRGETVWTLETPFPRWGWLDAPELELGPQTEAALRRVYERYWAALDRGDTAMIEAELETKARDFMAAYRLPNLATAQSRIGVVEHVEEPERELQPLNWEGVRLELWGNGRLAVFLDEEDDCPIYFSSEVLSFVLSCVYCRTEKGWLQVR